MSWEAWGDGPDDDTDHLIDAGWMTDTQAREVTEAIERVSRIASGSPNEALHLAVALLRDAAGLDVEEGMAEAAHDYFEENGDG
jgi:hypothetical protein